MTPLLVNNFKKVCSSIFGMWASPLPSVYSIVTSALNKVSFHQQTSENASHKQRKIRLLEDLYDVSEEGIASILEHAGIQTTYTNTLNLLKKGVPPAVFVHALEFIIQFAPNSQTEVEESLIMLQNELDKNWKELEEQSLQCVNERMNQICHVFAEQCRDMVQKKKEVMQEQERSSSQPTHQTRSTCTFSWKNFTHILFSLLIFPQLVQPQVLGPTYKNIDDDAIYNRDLMRTCIKNCIKGSGSCPPLGGFDIETQVKTILESSPQYAMTVQNCPIPIIGRLHTIATFLSCMSYANGERLEERNISMLNDTEIGSRVMQSVLSSIRANCSVTQTPDVANCSVTQTPDVANGSITQTPDVANGSITQTPDVANDSDNTNIDQLNFAAQISIIMGSFFGGAIVSACFMLLKKLHNCKKNNLISTDDEFQWETQPQHTTITLSLDPIPELPPAAATMSSSEPIFDTIRAQHPQPMSQNPAKETTQDTPVFL